MSCQPQCVSVLLCSVEQGTQHSNQSESTSSFVGFANLPNQVHRKIAKRGFEFTLMVVGKDVDQISSLVSFR